MARVRVKYTVRSAIDARAAATQCDCRAGHASVLDQLALEESVPVGRRVTLVDVMVAALALADSERPRIRELLRGQR
jgi:hypothetical protein